MAEPQVPRVEVSEARASLSRLIQAINAEKVPRILTRYGREVAILLPPGKYALIEAIPVEERTVVDLMKPPVQDSLTKVVPEP